MKKMLMLGSGWLSAEMVKYAKRLGVYTITTDYHQPERSRTKLISDEYWMISTAEIDLLERKCREEGITAIADGGDEFSRNIMIELCHRLDLPCYITEESCQYETDKSKFKQACREVGALVPTDYYVSPELTQEELEQIEYPVMVKPVDQSGNYGVAYCYGPEDVRKAYAEVRRVSDNPNTIIEKMIDGPEYAAYYAIANGEAKLVDVLSCYGVEEKPKNCYVLNTTKCACKKAFLETANDQVIALLNHIGCKEGYAWVQFMQEGDGPFYLIEMGYRLSGDGIHLTYPERHGFDAIEWLANCALGIPNDINRIDVAPPKKAHGLCYLLWTDKSGTAAELVGMEALASYPGMHIAIKMRKGAYYDRYVYPVILGCGFDTADEAVEMVEFVNDHVKLLDENGENMLMYYTDFDFLRKIC